ncbi:MAG: ROK family protein [Deltaproteobacteria bacterium]
MAHLVFDIGGSKTRAAVFDRRTSALLAVAVTATPNHLDLPDASFDDLRRRLLSAMQRIAREVAGACAVERVDVAFAGPLDREGRVVAAPTLWGTRLEQPYRIEEDLAQVWPRARIGVVNDVTAAGYRYYRPGEDFCIVTVSSGIGHKVFIGGRPAVGPAGAGGEIGHLRVDDSFDAPVCECGGRGHLGAIASGRGVLVEARRRQGREALSSGDLVAAFRRGESWAAELVSRSAVPLGSALAAMHLGVGIERFVLVGGFALALGEPYRRCVAAAASAHCWTGEGDWAERVELGIEDDHSGLIGAGIAGVTREEAA